MLLRQALEQTRSGTPAPISFNSRMAGLEPADEIFAMQPGFAARFHTGRARGSNRTLLPGTAGIEMSSSLPRRTAAVVTTGSHAS